MSHNLPSAPPTDAVADLGPDWLSAALASVNAGPVAQVSPTAVGTGQMGQSWRLQLEWADPEKAAAAGAPQSLVAKMAGGDPSTRTLIADGYRNEFLWYTQLANTVAINTPTCWYATITDDNTSFVLLLDDLAPAQPGVQANGVSVAQAKLSFQNLAGLHGPRWRDESLLEIDGLRLANAEGAAFHGQVYAGACPQFIERFANWLSDDDVETITATQQWMEQWLVARQEVFTLIHGDFRPDNLMFAPGDTSVSTLDWQTLGLGFGGRDSGYFLATSIDTELRRAHEQELLQTYYDALCRQGVQSYSFDECYADYRLGVLQGPLITILGAVYATATPTDASNAMFTAMITRSCAAIRDLHPEELL